MRTLRSSEGWEARVGRQTKKDAGRAVHEERTETTGSRHGEGEVWA